MVAIFTGGSVGLERSSVTKLGSQGVMDDAVQGRSGDSLFVNAATGNLVIEKQDEFLVGLGPDVSIVRTYNSLGDLSDENGDNWRQSTDRRLEFDSTNNVFTRVSGDGTRITYNWNAARNAYVAKDGAGAHRLVDQYAVGGGSDVTLEVTETGSVETRQFVSGTEWEDPLQAVWSSEAAPAFDTIVKVGTTSWRWTDGNTGAVEVYNTSGQLQSISDRDARILTYSYTGSRLTEITSSNGEWIKYTWSGNNIASVQTYASATTAMTRVFYTYDTSNRLSTVTVDLAPATTTSIGTTATPGSSVYKTTYTYDGTSKRVTSITQSDGSSFAVVYDASNRVQSLTQRISAGTTRITRFNYDQLDTDATSVGYNKTYTAIDYTTGQSPTPVAGQEARLYYDTNKNLTIAMSPLPSAGAGRQAVQFVYNADGTVWKAIDALGRTTLWTYDGNGNWLTQVSPGVGSGTTTVTRVHDADNQLLTETSFSSDESTGYNVSVAHTTRFSYDIEGHLRYVISAAGEVTEYRYTGAGQVSYEISYPEQTYDLTGLASTFAPTETQMNAWRDGLADRSSTEIAKYAYDLRGGLLNTIKYGIAGPAGGTSTTNGTSQYNYIYDQTGRLVSRVAGDPAAPVQQTATSYVYDGMGRVISTTGADGGVTTVSLQDKSSTTVVTLASGLVQTSVYNLAGELIAQTDNQGAPDNAASDLSTWTLTSNVTRTASTAIGGKPAFLYTVGSLVTTAATNSASQAVSAGETVTFEITIKETAGGASYERVGINATNDGWGDDNLSWATIVSGSGTISRYNGSLFTVDNLSTTQPTVVRVTRVMTAATTVKAYAYIGPLSSSAIAGDTAILSAPSLVHEFASASLLDSLGRQRVAIDATGNFSYSMYDGAGRKTGDVAGDGSLVEYRYDAGNQLIATIRYATRVSAANLTALLDPNTTLGIADILPLAAAGDEWAWTIYDNAGRVIETISGDGAVKRFDYDESGNLVRQTGYFDRLSAATLGSPSTTGLKADLPTTAIWPASTNSDWTYAGIFNQTRNFYDQQGRLIGSMDRYGALTEFVYDEAGRKIDEIRYEKLGASSFTNGQGVTVSRTSASFADIRANVVAQGGADRHTRTVYDGQVLRYVIDALGYVTQYDYDITGAGTTAIRYRNALPGTTIDYTFDNVKNQLVALASSASDRKSYNVLNAKGQLAYTIDGENAVTGYVYNTSGAVIRSTQYSVVWTPSAACLVADLDAWAASTPVGATTTIALAADNRTTRSFYDTRGQLVYVVDGAGYVTETSYDEEGRATAVTRYDHAISGLTDASGLANVDIKVAADRTAEAYSRTQTAYDVLGRVSDLTDAMGIVTHYDYYATGEVRKETAAYGTADAVVTSYVYDGAGQVTSKTEAAGTSIAATTSYTYDGLGNVVSVTDPGLAVTYNYYDRMGRLTSIRDAENYVTEMAYTSFGEVASVTRYANKTTTADVASVPDVSISTSDATTYSYYDKLGRVIWTRDAENYVTGTTYTSFGEVWKVTRYATQVSTSATSIPSPTISATSDATTTFAYDQLGRLLKTTDAETKFESQTYNAFGQIDTRTNKLGGTISYTYDKRGLLTKENAPAPKLVNGTQPAGGIDTVYTYDANRNRHSMIEADGLAEARTTVYGYDRNNRLVSVGNGGAAVPVLYMGVDVLTEGTAKTTTTTRYDNFGNVIETFVQATIGSDVTMLSRTLAWYDRLGRKSDEFKTGTSIGKGTLSHWGYYATGTTASVSVRGSEVSLAATTARPDAPLVLTNDVRTTSYTYDKLDRLTETKIAGVLVGRFSGSAYSYDLSKDVKVTNLYDAGGNLIRQTDGRGDNTYFYYDKLGRKTEQVDRESYLTTWALDEDGNTVDEVRYAGKVVGTVTTAAAPSVAPDSAKDRSTHFTYDRMGRRLTEERAGVIKASQDANGVVLKDTSGNVITATAASVIIYTYNALGEVASKQEATGDTTSYTYDTMGRMTKETDASQPVSGSSTAQTPVTQFWYDGLGNLTRSDENGRVTQYTYYASGKLKTLTNANSATRTYYYDGAGNKVAEKYLRKAGDTIYDAMTYTYDAAGRLTAQGYATVSGTTWSAIGDKTQMGYNAYGEVIGRGINLTSAQIAAGAYQDQFAYDNAGHMWRTTAGDGTVNLYVYDENGNQTLEITSSGAGLANNRVWANPTGTQTQLNLTTALNLLTNNGASSVGAIAVQGIIVTQSVYDGRNQLTQILMPMRDGTSLGNYSTSPYKTSKSYNAFGEVASEADARANAANPTNPITTNYSYNTLGKVIRRELPPVNWTAENGAIATARPTENYFYDASGRVVGVEDANGNVNTRTLLAGTGYGKDDEALVLKEYHADGGIFQRQYDLHHDMVKTINEVTKTENYVYDDLGQLIEQDHEIRSAGSPGNDLTGAVAVQLKDYYAYDNLGHRIEHTNSQLGSTVKETTAYDIQGRVTSQIDLGGDTTSYSYAWNGSLVTTGLGTFGGWTKVTTNSSLKTRTDKTDYFGRTIDMIDYGGHNYDYTFDLAGRMVREQILSTGRDVVYAYYNTGLLQSVISTSMAMVAPLYTPTVRMVSIYKYDADNHRTFESYKKETASGGTWAGTSSGTSPNTVWIDGSWTTAPTWSATATYQNATVAWDAAGRMTAFDSTTVAGGANVNIDYEYDRVGNVRRMVSDYKGLDGDGNTVATASRQEYWYKYDEMNRFVTTKGSFAGTRGSGVIAKGSEGTNLTYDAAGNRKTATTSELLYKRIYKSNVGNLYSDTVEDWTGGGSWVNWQYLGDRKDTYVYSSDGYLSSVAITQQDLNANGTSQLTVAALDTGPGLTRSRYTRDAMGRVTDLVEYQSNGTTVAYDRSVTYNTRSQVMYEDTYTLQENQTVTHINTRYSYSAISDGQGGWKGDWSTTAGAVYMGGVVTLTKTTGDEVTSGGSTNVLDTTRSTYTFQWWGDAEQVRMDHDVDFNNTSNNIWYSARTLDESGHLVAAHIGGTGSGTDARPRDLAFINDANGQVLQRDETDYIDTTTGNPRELHYYFDGRRIGDISNNGTSNTDYASSIAARNDSGYGAFRGGANSPTAYADFDQSYDAINGLSYASTSSRYTVQGGDTLTSIAQAVWGDASFWYMIADSNGLDGTETLVAGQSLILPNKVHNSHNNSSTYRVYDPNEAIGDTAPTAAAPPKTPGCGGFGAIFLAIIAIAIVAIVAPPLIGAPASMVPATTITVGTLSTTLPAITLVGATGLTATLGAVGGAIVGGALAAATGSIVSQGIGLATGLQDSFSWKSVGMAALGGAVGGALGKFNAFGSGAKGIGAVGNTAVRGAMSNGLIQGVGVATGLQDRFDWTGVAAACIGAGASNAIGGAGFVQSMGGFGQGLTTNMAGSIANAATRSLIDGTDFGDNIMAALPDVIANTVGNLVADAVAGGGKSKAPLPSADELQVSGKVLEVGIEAQQVGGDGSLKPLPSAETQADLLRRLKAGGETIPIRVRYLDEAGKERTRVQDYQIRGTDYDFTSIDGAAFDGIAASWWMREQLQDNFERGGDILSHSVAQADGSTETRYYYNSIETGFSVNTRNKVTGNPSLDIYSEEGRNGVSVSRRAVAWWHLHPAEDRSDNASFQRSADDANRNFSPGDVGQAQMLAGEKVRIPAYLSSPAGQVYRNDHLWDGSKGTVEIGQFGRFKPSDYIDQGLPRRK